MNVELLEKVKQHILEEPKRLRMGTILHTNAKERGWDNTPVCNTVGCIAGWTCVLGGSPAVRAHSSIARDLLDVTHEQGERLFFSYPDGFEHIFDDDGSEETAKLVAKRIDLFIKTNGEE